MYLKKLIAASIAVGALTFTPNVCQYPLMSVAHAEIKTYTGVGEYVMSNFETPDSAMERAKAYALRDAQEQAGIYVQSYSKAQNFKLVEDEITTMTAGIINVIDTEIEPIPVKDTRGAIKYVATMKVNIDTDDISKWLKRNNGEQLNALIEQNKALQKEIAEQEKIISNLRKQVPKVKTQEDKDKITEEFTKADNEFLATQKAQEAKKYYEDGKYNETIESCNEAIKLNPKLALAYTMRGKAYGKLENFSAAMKDYDEAIKLNPNDYYIYYSRAYDSKDYNKAIEDLNKSIKLNSHYSYSYHLRGFCYNVLNDYNNAIKDLTKAIALNPNFVESYVNRGYAYYKLQNYKQAIEDFNSALKVDPDYFMAYYLRSSCYTFLGDDVQAQADLKKAEQLQNRGN